jgi:hypothetical protein
MYVCMYQHNISLQFHFALLVACIKYLVCILDSCWLILFYFCEESIFLHRCKHFIILNFKFVLPYVYIRYLTLNWLQDRVILAAKNEGYHEIMNQILAIVLGIVTEYKSVDNSSTCRWGHQFPTTVPKLTWFGWIATTSSFT